MFGDSLVHPSPLTSADSESDFLKTFSTCMWMPYFLVHIKGKTLEAQLTRDEHYGCRQRVASAGCEVVIV